LQVRGSLLQRQQVLSDARGQSDVRHSSVPFWLQAVLACTCLRAALASVGNGKRISDRDDRLPKVCHSRLKDA
jgi:hypothetical protein